MHYTLYMTSLWIIFGIIQVGSIGLTLLSLQRLYSYIRRYRFSESKYTLLFGFIHLRWITFAYLSIMIAWIAVSYGIFTII